MMNISPSHLPLLRRLALVEGLAMAGFVMLYLHTGRWPVLGGVIGAVVGSFFYLRRLSRQQQKGHVNAGR